MEETAEQKAEREALEQSKNDASKATLTPEEIADLRKKAEQAEMRARQLENQAKAREEADEKARQKKLEEDEEYKELAARAQARADEAEAELERSKKGSAITAAQSTILSDYSSDVTELASTAGLVLSDDSDEAKAAFKVKLDAIAAKLGPTKKVVGNNGVRTPQTDDETERQKDTIRMRVDKASGYRAIGNLDALKQMRENAGVTRSEV